LGVKEQVGGLGKGSTFGARGHQDVLNFFPSSGKGSETNSRWEMPRAGEKVAKKGLQGVEARGIVCTGL